MKWIALTALLVGCAPAAIEARAIDRLGTSHHRQVYLVDKGTLEGDDLYMFCRDGRRDDDWGLSPITAGKRYAKACVMYVCKPNQPASQCTESGAGG